MEDNEEKNVVLPMTSMVETVFGNEEKQCFQFMKIDPSKKNWGNITVECGAELAQTNTVTWH